MINQKITRRQLQFLESVVKLYEEKQFPISYKEVATSLGVSRWTAYDILQELYRKGYLEAKYRPVGGPGRSEILFAPTEEAVKRVKESSILAPITAISKWMTDVQKKIEKLSINSAINFVFDRVKNESNSFIVVLYTTSLAIILTKVFNVELNNMLNLKAVLESNTYAPAVLMFIVESIYTILEDKYNEEKIALEKDELDKFNDILKKFRESVSQVSPSFQDKVVKYLSALI